MLIARYRERTLEIRLRFRRIGVRRHERDFAGNAMHFSEWHPRVLVDRRLLRATVGRDADRPRAGFCIYIA